MSSVRTLGMTACLVVLTVLGLGEAATASTANDLVTERGFYVDADGQASIESVQSASFEPFGPVLNAGYASQPYWLRLSLPAGEVGGPSWVVRVLPAWHDEVLLYDPQFSNVPMRLGDAAPAQETDHRSLSLSFGIPQSDQARTIFLRVDSPHSMIVDAVVVDQVTAARIDQNGFSFLAGYLGFLCAIFILSFLTWLSDRERVIGVFCIQLVAAIVYSAAMYGLLRIWFVPPLSPSLLNLLTHAMIVVYPSTTLVFYRFFYCEFGLSRWVARSLDCLVILNGFSLVLIGLGLVGLALSINAVILLISALLILLAPWFFLRPIEDRASPLPPWTIRLSGLVLGLPALVGIVRTLNVLPESQAPVSLYLFHAMMLSIIVAMVMQYRSRKRAVALEESRLLAVKEAQHERTLRETLEKFMSMLGHEIRTPLSVLRLSVDESSVKGPAKIRAQGAIEDIDRLVSRCLDADAVANGEIEPVLAPVLINPIIDATIARLNMADRIVWQTQDEVTVIGDDWFIQVMVSNLLENAQKYAIPNSMIELSLSCRADNGDEGPTGLLRVSNQIEPDQRIDTQRIFDQFYRESWAKRYSGAGLGLYLTQSLAKMLKGGVACRQPSEGVVEMELVLPQ